MRREPTDAERALWQALRNRSLESAKFRLQHEIGHLIVDFYCADARLVVEVDGSVHDSNSESDYERTRYFESLGLRVIRIRNEEILGNIGDVLARIALAVLAWPLSPSRHDRQG